MSRTYTIEEIEGDMAALLTSADSAPFQQTGRTVEAWAESLIPLTAMQDSGLEQHLAFSVSIEDTSVVDDGNLAEYGHLTVLAELSVLYMYRIRTDDQRRDQRAAASAARYLAASALALSPYWGRATCTTLYRPAEMVGSFLPVEQRYQVLFDCQLPGI